jgi:L-histidine N-alpha-methyltransferase
MMHEQLIRSGSETAERAQMRAEVWSGLARAQKEISPKYFYDARGSGLFEAITRLPEYYPTRTELALLHAFAPAWVARLRPRALVELGPGSAEKARTVLDGMAAGGVYMPVDISPSYLAGIVAEIGADYPHIEVVTAHSDIRALAVPPGLPRPAAFAFLGSTIGNFDAAAASALLRRVRDNMQDTDRFLLGVDLVKDVATLEAAYNDASPPSSTATCCAC